MEHNISYLFLRGLSRNQYHWNQRDTYEKILNNQVHFLDLPGFGTNAKFHSPKTIDLITDNVKYQLDNLSGFNPKTKKVIVGLSLGGLVTLNWVSRHIQDWDGLVIINSSLANLSWPWQRLKPKNYLNLIGYFLSPDPKHVESIIYNVTCNTDHNKKELIERWTQVRLEYPFRRRDVLNQVKAASYFRSPPKFSLTIPGLVLAGPKDRMVDYKCSKAIADKYGFQLKLSQISGHDMAVDDLPWMLQQIKDFSAQL